MVDRFSFKYWVNHVSGFIFDNDVITDFHIEGILDEYFSYCDEYSEAPEELTRDQIIDSIDF